MFCSGCGKKLIDTAAFCSYCGSKIAIPQKEDKTNSTGVGENRSHVDVGLRDQDKIYVLIAHLGAIILTFFAPLIIFLLKKDKPLDNWVRQNAANSLNFQITLIIVLISILLVPTLLIQTYIQSGNGIFEMARRAESTEQLIALIQLASIVAVLTDYILCIVAAVKSTSGDVYRYPIAIRFIKHSEPRTTDVASTTEQTIETGKTKNENARDRNVESGNQVVKSIVKNSNETPIQKLPKKFKFVLTSVVVLCLAVMSYVYFTKDTYRVPALTDSIINSGDTEFQTRVHTNYSRLDVYRNINEGFSWVKDGSKILLKVYPSDGMPEPVLLKEEGPKQYWVFSSYAGNACEGPHNIVITTANSVKVVEIKTCAQWGYVQEYLTISGDSVKYSPPK